MDKESWDRRYAEADLVWSREPNRFLVEQVAGLSPGRALDLGAGEGRNAIWLAERGWTVTAVDFSTVGLTKGSRLAAGCGVDEISWVQADLTTWTPPERSFELVLLLYLHLPWAEMAGVLDRAVAAVAPGGTLLLIGHDRANLEHGHGGPQNPAVLYTAEEIAAGLPGLDVVTTERRPREVRTDAGAATALDCLVRAVRPAAPSG